jgi:DNA-binding beta-propeller fold protein YncE
VFLCAGCAGPAWKGFSTTPDPNRVWPLPPEQPRLAFVQTIHSHTDLFEEQGFWRHFMVLMAGPSESGMERPFAVALHPKGGLLVTDTARRKAHFYNWARGRYVELGPQHPKGELPSPVGIAALPSGEILVSDSKLESVELFDEKGKWLRSFVEPGRIARPAGIAVNGAKGEVYVADVRGHCVQVLDLQGGLLRKIGTRGEGDVQFNFPTHLALTPEGNLAVTDSMNFRVQVVTPEGQFVKSVGRMGQAPGQFSKPKGVAVDGAGRLMAVEGLYDGIEFFDVQGRFLFHLGGSGSEPGQFWLPGGLAFDPAENLLFVADSYNGRVQVFRLLKEGGAQESRSKLPGKG